MIVGRFAPYTAEQASAAAQDLDAEPGSWVVFNLLTLPFFGAVGERGPRIGTEKERPRKLKRIKRAFRPLLEEDVTADRAIRRLRYAGGEVVLEDEEFRVLKAVWEELRAQLDVAFSEAAVAVDEWIEQVQSFTPEAWKAELERRATASAPEATDG